MVHLARRASQLYAASELGDHLTWDLATLEQGYCDLLREVWRDVPVVYERGEVRVLEPPPGHSCPVR